MDKSIFFTVTNDLVYDQRMQRICSSMAHAGYKVTLVGREKTDSPPLRAMPFSQVRLPMKYHSGKMFYLEFNYKLYRFLRHAEMDAICAIDLDTIVPVYLVSRKKRIPRMYDAHEFFTEMIEVKRRPHIHFFWKQIEKCMVPRFSHGYTVSRGIAEDFEKLYGVRYALVRNMPFFTIPVQDDEKVPTEVTNILKRFDEHTDAGLPYFLYQGAINEGRALHALIDAFRKVNARLLLAGGGNLEEEVKAHINKTGSTGKVYMCGNVTPPNLRFLTARCFAGITLFDAYSKNQYYSLGNKFFDYIMAHKPQVCILYPEYAAILKNYPVAVPIVSTKPDSIADSLNKLLHDLVLYEDLKNVCIHASKDLNWESEEKFLLSAWDKLFATFRL